MTSLKHPCCWHRRLDFGNGKILWEELLSIDDPNMAMAYEILPYDCDGRPPAADASPFPRSAEPVCSHLVLGPQSHDRPKGQKCSALKY